MILVIGGTGNVGSEVVRLLLAAGRKVRVLVRDEPAAARRLGPGVELAVGDLGRPETLDPALRGVEQVYLLAPVVPNLRELEATAIDAARRAGVKKIVKHSNMGAQAEPGITLPRWHRAGELRIEGSGMAWTFVRPTGFMTNARSWAGMIKSQGVVYAPGGAGKLSMVDPRDIAAVAAAALLEPGHDGHAYDITGPAAISVAEQVEQLAAALGRPLRHVEIPDVAAHDAMIKLGMPAVIVDAMLEFVALTRAGQGTTVTDTVQRVTGRAARTFDAWAHENVAAFR